MSILVSGGAGYIGSYTIYALIEADRVTGHPIPAEICPRRDGVPARLVASSQKAEAVLGWKPRYTDLDAMVASAWKWHRDHSNGFQS